MPVAARIKIRTKTKIASDPARRVRSLWVRRTVGLSFLFSSVLLAQAPDADALFEQGRIAFEQLDFARALESFEAAAAAHMEGPVVHFNLGVAAYKIGQYDKARAAFQRVAQTPTMAGLAYYNLGLVALAQKNEAAAIDAFTRAYAVSEDERVQALARTQLEAVGRTEIARSWAVYGSTGIGYDDNVTLTSGSQALGITRESDIYADTYVSGSMQLSRAWRIDADVSLLNYADLNEFDQWGVGAGARYRFQWRPWFIDAGGHLGATYLDGEPFDVRETAYVQARRALTGAASLRGRYRLSHVDGSDEFPGLNGLLHELSARVVQSWSSWTAGLGYAYELNDYDAAALSALRHQLSADVRTPLTRSWHARASVAYRLSDYDDPAIGGEDRFEVGAGAELALSDRWTLAIQYSFTNNDADAPAYKYRRNRLFVGIDGMF